MNAPWDPTDLMSDADPYPDRRQAIIAMQAISDAFEGLDVVNDEFILFDLRTSVSTRVVAMPAVMHRHDQECNRS